MPGILGKKIGMTRIVKEDGTVVPLTIIQCDPNTITQVKSTEKDGYTAIVVGFSELKNPTKNRKYHFVREFKVENPENYKIGDKITVESLADIENVNFTAISKGKGFQGVVKRHHFTRGPMSHGSKHHRAVGSTGQRVKPSRVIRGKRMPGRMGTDTITIKNVPIVHRDTVNNLISLKGPVPGGKNNLIAISF